MRTRLALLLLAAVTTPAAAQREVAVTFDDIPAVALPQRSCAAIEAANRKLLASLARHRVPATAFVVGGRACDGDRTALPRLLDLWLNAGHELGNHSYLHRDLNSMTLAAYERDVVRGEDVLRKALSKRGRKLVWYRHPFLHAGQDTATKRALDAFLAARGYRVGVVTIDNQEWVFAEAYARAQQHGDDVLSQRIATSYLAYMDTIFAFFEQRSRDIFGHEIPQVLLLHMNALNADHFDALAQLMRRRGYRFVTLGRATAHPAYRSADGYVGPRGLSWLHRWGLARGVPLREEPPEPAWVRVAGRE